jgi:hypothetical protein
MLPLMEPSELNPTNRSAHLALTVPTPGFPTLRLFYRHMINEFLAGTSG